MEKSKMDTGPMLHFKVMDAVKANRQFIDAAELRRKSVALYNECDMNFVRTQIVEVVEQNYDLGKVIEVYEIFGGYVNRSFGIICEKNGKRTDYFVRKYKARFNSEANPNDILYEHNLINYCLKKGLKEAAKVYTSNNGTTMVSLKDFDDTGRELNRYFAVYDFLEGEDRYTWINNENKPEEFKNLGALQARFHNYGQGFDPGSLAKAEPKTKDFVPTLPDAFRKMAGRDLPDSIFHATFNSKLHYIINIINENTIPAEAFAKMPQSPIHSDLHAGNVKWVGEDCTGIFDFDWSKIDVRLFDICFALVYCCSSWRPESDGVLRLADCRNFLEGYNAQLNKLDGLESINATEKKYFAHMLLTACAYLTNWCTSLFFYEDPEIVNDYEALYYLLHITRLMEWISAHRDEVNRTIADV